MLTAIVCRASRGSDPCCARRHPRAPGDVDSCLRRPVVDPRLDGQQLSGGVERGGGDRRLPVVGRQQRPQVALAALGVAEDRQVVVEQEHGGTVVVEGRRHLERVQLRSPQCRGHETVEHAEQVGLVRVERGGSSPEVDEGPAARGSRNTTDATSAIPYADSIRRHGS